MKKDWILRTEFAMGGTTNLGFSPDSKYLLVITSSGRSLYDVKTMEMISRDRDLSFKWHRDTEADGIGPCEGIIIPINGIHAEIPNDIMDEISDFDLDSFITEFKGAAITPDNKVLAIGYSSDIQIYNQLET